MKIKTTRRTLAWALALCMVLALLPAITVPALAASSNSNAAATLTLATGTVVGAQGDDLYWDGAGNLTLNNFTYITTAETALQVPDGTTITLTGTNTITSNYSGTDKANGIYASGALTIQGTGSLTVTAGAAKGTGLYCRGKVTVSGGIINVNGGDVGIGLGASTAVSGGIVIADGGNYGIWADSGVLSVTGNGTVVVKGSVSALYLGDGAGNPSNADVLGINASDDAYDVATMYSDSEGQRHLKAAEDRTDVTNAIIVAQGVTPPTPLALAEMAIPAEPTPIPAEPTPAPAEPTPAPINPTPAPASTPAPAEPTPVNPAPPSSGNENNSNPETGDNSPIILMVLALLSSGTLAVVLGRRKYKNSEAS